MSLTMENLMTVTRDQLIARQALKIEKLASSLADATAALGKIHSELVCIGGPLNDNKLSYTPQQLQIFYRIERLAADA